MLHTSVIPIDVIEDLAKEVMRAKEKFPRHLNLHVALLEEVGELAKASLHQEPPQRIRAEAIQVMAVAFRIFTEGDASLDLSDESKQR